jgi:hypothetical protein
LFALLLLRASFLKAIKLIHDSEMLHEVPSKEELGSHLSLLGTASLCYSVVSERKERNLSSQDVNLSEDRMNI